MTGIEELLRSDAGLLMDQTFTGSAQGAVIVEAEVEDCRFEATDLQQSTMKSSSLTRCSFHECNLANAQFVNTVFTECRFVDSKLVGSDWSRAGLSLLPPVTITFEGCLLDYCSFARANLSRARFIDCSLRDADFTDANLSKATLTNCELGSTRFHGTDLRYADLRGSHGYFFDPRDNQTRELKLSAPDATTLLTAFGIHVD